MGTNDIAKETRARIIPGRAPMIAWLSRCVVAARAYGIDVLDGVWNQLADMDGCAPNASRAATSAWTARPSSIPTRSPSRTRSSRRPPPKWNGRARSSQPSTCRRTPTRASISLDGKMVELLHAEMARRTLAIADGGRGAGLSGTCANLSDSM